LTTLGGDGAFLLRPRVVAVAVAVAASVALAACGAIGAAGIDGGRERYQDAIRRTGEEQMLLNLVRLQADELPSFLQISQISSQLTASANAGANVTVGASTQALLPFGGSVSEAPTVTYLPLQGEDFDNTLLRRIPAESLVSLQRGGWSAREVFRMIVYELGALHNVAPKASPLLRTRRFRRGREGCTQWPTPTERKALDTFNFAMDTLDDLIANNVLDLDLEPLPRALRDATDGGGDAGGEAGDGKTDHPSAGDQPVLRLVTPGDAETWQKILGVVGEGRDWEGSACLEASPRPEQHPSQQWRCLLSGQCLEHGPRTTPQYAYLWSYHHDERIRDVCHIPVTTRTLLEIMTFLSAGVSTPDGCAHDRWTQKCDDPEGEVHHGQDPFFRVYCSASSPPKAAVRVSYGDNWFYIRDDDLRSRRTFSLLMLLFQQQLAKSIPAFGPTLTLPVGH
jgi:hypothetical protein